MGNQKNFIEINGKRYDAVTGAMLDGGTTQAAPKASAAQPKPIAAAKPVVDGFVKRPRHMAAVPVARGSANTPVAHAQKAKTLMRSAVKKPTALKPVSADIKPTHTKTTPHKPVASPRTAGIPETREKLAHIVKKSSLIHKFGAPQMPAQVVKKVAPLEVQAAPVVHTPSHSEVTKSKTADLLDRALEAAQSHNEPFFEPKQSLNKRIAKKIGVSGKAVAITTTVMAGLVIGGLYAYQNVPNLAMKVAATRAGFGAAMPSYAPSGFGFHGPVQYSAGQVVVSFKSNSDNRNYKLTQQTSSWTSESLLNNYVAASGKEYQTYLDRGRTIYIYDGSNATWVNGGVWYQIEGNSDLTSDQLVRIAASL